jgi:hypothetical protein
MAFELSSWRTLHDVVDQVLAAAAPQSVSTLTVEMSASGPAVHSAPMEFGGVPRLRRDGKHA